MRFVGLIVLPTIEPLSDHLQIFNPILEMFSLQHEGCACLGHPTSTRNKIKL